MSSHKVLILNSRDITNPRAGGAELHVWKIFSRAAQQGWDVTVLCSKYRGAKPEECIDGIRVVRCGGEFSIFGLWPFAFRRLVRRLQPEIVVEFINKLPFFSPLHSRLPVMCFVHHLFGDAAHHEFPRPLAWLVKTCESLIPFVYRRNMFLTGSESTLAELASLGLPRANLHTVPYGVDVDAYSPGTKSKTPRIIFVGRLKKYKGIGDLLEAAAALRQSHPDLHVDIVGQGDARESLEALADTLGLEGVVTFHGFVDEKTKLELYQRAWIACLPSAKEGFGLTIPEAALCEIPTVGYDVCGVRDAIVSGETGILVPWRDVAQFTNACASLLEDFVLRTRMGVAARQSCVTFTWDNSAECMLNRLDHHLVAPTSDFDTPQAENKATTHT